MVYFLIPTGRSVIILKEYKNFMTQTSQKLITRSRILETALDLISRQGYEATSVADICNNAHISKGAFYYHFPSKQDLFLVLMTNWLDEVDKFFQLAASSARNVPDALERIAGTTGYFFNNLESGFPILLEFWQQASRQPQIWEQAVAPYRHYLDYFADFIQSGIEEGAFEKDTDPQLTARLFLAVAMGLLLQASFDPNGADWQEITRSGIKTILDGIRRSK